MKWTSVEEKLPKKDGKYLVHTKNLTGYSPLKENVFIAEFYYDDWKFKGWEDNSVTHWMKLPKAPKEI